MKKIVNISITLTLVLIHGFLFSGFTAINPLQDGGDYAMIYIYRTKTTGGGEYRMHFNDRLIETFKKGDRLSYKIYSEGALYVKTVQLLMGNTLPGEDVYSLSVKNGNEYYLELTSGGRIESVTNEQGKNDFNNMNLYKKEPLVMEEDINIPILKLPQGYQAQGQNRQNNNEDQNAGYRGGGDPLKGLNISKAKPMVIGNYYALIIGIDKYSGYWKPLKNAVHDAKAVETLLKSKYKFDYFKTMYDEQAIRKNVIKEMEWLLANVKEKDNVLIYYSGHGQFNKQLNKGYWVPIDATTNSTSEYISNNDIQTFLGGIKSSHTLLVSDACFSGDIFRGSTVSVPFEDSQKYYDQVHGLVSRQAITSGGIEPVMDGGRDGHSVFAYYLLKTLQNNEEKYFDASQLYGNVKIPVINNSNQTPEINSIKNAGDEGGQFIFIKK